MKIFKLSFPDIGGKTHQHFYFSTIRRAKNKEKKLQNNGFIKLDIEIEEIELNE